MTGLPTGGAPRTVLAWVKPSTAPGYPWEGIFSYGAWSGGTFFSLERRENGGAYLMGHSVDLSGSAGTLAVDQWTHVAVTYDGTLARLWINGSPDTDAALALNTASSAVHLGHTPPNDGFHAGFKGTLDEVALFSRALSQTEIQEAMASPVPEPGTSALLAAGLALVIAGSRRRGEESTKPRARPE